MTRHCDIVVVGSGAAGLTTAITAAKAGLDVIIIEKSDVFGGTTALSGGVLWIPGNSCSAVPDSREAVRTYLRHEAGALYDEAAVEAYLEHGPEMIEYIQRETEVRFLPTEYPDYHAEAPGGARLGRSVVTAPYDARALGDEIRRLRKPLAAITFMGMMFNSTNRELRHFFNVTKSPVSALFVMRKLLRHFMVMARYGRAVDTTGGNALVARLAKTALDAGIPLLTSMKAERLLIEGGAIRGLIAESSGELIEFRARRGVVLACGGFANDPARQKIAYWHVAKGGEHCALAPADVSGDGITLAEQAGANFAPHLPHPAAWMPASLIPGNGDGDKPFPHIVDRYKPGVIAVSPEGVRFTNEANSYHDFCAAMLRSCGEKPIAWLICDHRTIRKYGLGFAKPSPVPLGGYLRSGYLKKAATPAALAVLIGVDPRALEATLEKYNRDARIGEDSEFKRGSAAFNRFLGDAEHLPNPNVAPVDRPPFYAIRLMMGDIGTFDGIETDANGRVLRPDGTPVEGLFAVGNDRKSMMGGNYPGAGITLGPAMTFGYLTGRYLAAPENRPDNG